MKILAIEKEVPSPENDDFRPYLKPEAARVWELQQAGIIREIYFTKGSHYAVIILECSNVNETKEVLSSLPLVKAGLIEFEVLPLMPYDGFARLFGE